MPAAFRADHVGSLLRPPELIEAREAHAGGRLSAERLREAEDAAILKALDVQREAGLDVFSDGEYRRGIWYGPLTEAIEGFIPDPNPVLPVGVGWRGRGSDLANDAMAEVGQTRIVAGDRLRQLRRLTGHESGFLREHAPGPWKITMPGVFQRAVAWYKPGVSDKFYSVARRPGRSISSRWCRARSVADRRRRVLYPAGFALLRHHARQPRSRGRR